MHLCTIGVSVVTMRLSLSTCLCPIFSLMLLYAYETFYCPKLVSVVLHFYLSVLIVKQYLNSRLMLDDHQLLRAPNSVHFSVCSSPLFVLIVIIKLFLSYKELSDETHSLYALHSLVLPLPLYTRAPIYRRITWRSRQDPIH